MKKKYILILIAFLSIAGARAQQASRLIGLTKTRYMPTASVFTPQDSAAYMYHGSEDTTNGGNMAFDSSYTFAYMDSITVNNQSYRTYQTLTGNNLTTTLIQWYDTSAGGWQNYTLNNTTFNSDNNVTVRTIQIWDSVGHVWQNSTHTANTYTGTNLSVRIRQNWIVSLNNWRNNLKDSFYYDGNGNTIYHRQQSWDTIGNAWVNSTLVTSAFNGINQVTETIHQVWDPVGFSWTNSANDLFHYDVQNRLVNSIVQRLDSVTNDWRNNGEDSLVYDGSDNISIEYKNSWDTTNNVWRNVNMHEYTYDASKNMLTDTQWNWNNANSIYRYNSYNTYTYNSFNQVLVYTTTSWQISSQTWIEKGSDLQYRYYYETFILPMSVSNVNAPGTLNVYPVPAQSRINIVLSWAQPQAFTIGIYDITGNLIKQWGGNAAGAYRENIPVNDLAPGNYFIKATGSKQQITQQFVIVR